MYKYIIAFLSFGALYATKNKDIKWGKQEVEDKSPFALGYYDEDIELMNSRCTKH